MNQKQLLPPSGDKETLLLCIILQYSHSIFSNLSVRHVTAKLLPLILLG